MANPFTSFAFPATGSNQVNRTLPNRLTDIQNVKNFGAKGDGVTDDWQAITNAIQAITPSGRGLVYFPPGTYLVSKSIVADGTLSVNGIMLSGELNLSTITGNFSDYIIKTIGITGNLNVIERLNVINNNATGGGMRIGATFGGAVRDCLITAYRGINDYAADGGSQPSGSLEFTVENCNLTGPGGTVSGSIGIAKQANGMVTNCRVIGYETGYISGTAEGGMYVNGCYFQQCGTGMLIGELPSEVDFFVFKASAVLGCWFKNCSIGIYSVNSIQLCKFVGIIIEGADGQAPGSLNCQYGLVNGNGGNGNQFGLSWLAGITVTGKFDIAGIYIYSGTDPTAIFTAIGVTNTSATGGAKPWAVNFLVPGNPVLPQFGFCSGGGDYPFIYDVANLYTGNEGDEINVSNGTNSLAWGATVTNTGTHTTHYLTRYNGSNWTVMGQ